MRACYKIYFKYLFLISVFLLITVPFAAGGETTGTYPASTLNTSERLLNLEAGGAATSYGFAGLSLRTRKIHTMIAEYLAALDKDPQNLNALTGLAGAWEALGQWGKALDVYKKIKPLKQDSKAVERKIESLKSMGAYRIRLNFSYLTEDQYLPALNRSVYKWNEAAAQMQIARHWGPDKTASIGFLRSHIDQTAFPRDEDNDEIYEDTDFNLLRQAAFVHLAWPFSDFVNAQMRLRHEIFESRDDDAYYQLDAAEKIWTGYLMFNYSGDNTWANLSYSRERDPDPLYDPATDRAQLNIEIKELSGLEAGLGLTPSWEIAGSVFYEHYGTLRTDQFNINSQLTCRPSLLPNLQTALGAAYYMEEYEKLVNWTISYQWNSLKLNSLKLNFLKRMGLKLEYQLEYSANEDSWLNQGELLLSWHLSPRLSFVIRSNFGEESHGDHDSYFLLDSGVEYLFY